MTRPLRHGFDILERWLADAIEDAAQLTRNSIQEASDGYRLRVEVLHNGNTDERLFSCECDSFIEGLEVVARELGVAFPAPALATLEAAE